LVDDLLSIRLYSEKPNFLALWLGIRFKKSLTSPA